MEQSLTLHEIGTMLTGDQMWRHRTKGEMTEGCFAISRCSYQQPVWERNEYVYKTVHRYFVGTYHDGKVLTGKGTPFKGDHEWFPFDVTQAQYDRVKRAKEKIAQQEAAEKAAQDEARRQHIKAEREEQKRKEAEEAARRAEYEKQAAIERAAEELRRSKTVTITVGELEDILSRLSELEDKVSYLEDNVEYRYRSEEE